MIDQQEPVFGTPEFFEREITALQQHLGTAEQTLVNAQTNVVRLGSALEVLAQLHAMAVKQREAVQPTPEGGKKPMDPNHRLALKAVQTGKFQKVRAGLQSNIYQDLVRDGLIIHRPLTEDLLNGDYELVITDAGIAALEVTGADNGGNGQYSDNSTS